MQQKSARRDVMLGESVEYKTHPLLSVSFSFTVREAGEVGGGGAFAVRRPAARLTSMGIWNSIQQ